MLNANHMLTRDSWRQEPNTLFARISEHYIVDENVFVDELVKVLDGSSSARSCTSSATRPARPIA